MSSNWWEIVEDFVNAVDPSWFLLTVDMLVEHLNSTDKVPSFPNAKLKTEICYLFCYSKTNYIISLF